ncbi:MAG: phosphatase [Beijerinckiaceae bacterium]|jgi:hypothetical protein|nr:phosphatase [Beijerinckiaceae bacterium]
MTTDTIEPFAIADLPCATGRLGIARLPGRTGDLASDVQAIAQWGARLVLSMTEPDEMAARGAADLAASLVARGIGHAMFPIPDFGTPGADAGWASLSRNLHRRLAAGERILLHCMGGKGRSGMVAMRLLVEQGLPADEALAMVRRARPGAVETEAQAAWASREAR